MLLLCFGYGYTAQRLGQHAAARGVTVRGTTRDGRSGTLAYDGSMTPQLRTAMQQATHILISIPPHAQEEALAQAIAQEATQCRWIGYLSTTGVYGDRQGRTVTEHSTTAPMDAQSEARVQAELRWRAQGAQVFRLSGIYGPGRSVFDSIAEGRAQRIVKAGHRFNRIHVDDIVRALWASMQASTPGAIYNLADDAPAAQADVMAYAHQLLRLPVPDAVPIAQAKLSPQAARFWASSRHVDASKIKQYHGISWKYPTYREGLAAILQESRSITP